jgi:hypothetical protein
MSLENIKHVTCAFPSFRIHLCSPSPSVFGISPLVVSRSTATTCSAATRSAGLPTAFSSASSAISRFRSPFSTVRRSCEGSDSSDDRTELQSSRPNDKRYSASADFGAGERSSSGRLRSQAKTRMRMRTESAAPADAVRPLTIRSLTSTAPKNSETWSGVPVMRNGGQSFPIPVPS